MKTELTLNMYSECRYFYTSNNQFSNEIILTLNFKWNSGTHYLAYIKSLNIETSSATYIFGTEKSKSIDPYVQVKTVWSGRSEI